jgi:undecaprenyl-diphosphatase
MADIIRAIALGAVQALTEFFPVSSSGHLALLGPILENDGSSLTFDVGLHAGTAAAVLVYFAGEWVEIARDGIRDLREHGQSFSKWSLRGRLGVFIAAATTPAVAVGAGFGTAIEERLRTPQSIALMLFLGAVVMAFADRRAGQGDGLHQVTLKTALVIGAAQAIALVPGVSRSGITITAARGLGLDRAAAVKFSFLLSTPVIIGALTLQAVKAAGSPDVEWRLMLIGATTAFLLGVAAIRVLLAFVVTHTLMPFVWYRIALAGAVLVSLIV